MIRPYTFYNNSDFILCVYLEPDLTFSLWWIGQNQAEHFERVQFLVLPHKYLIKWVNL